VAEVKRNLGREPKQVVADGGFINRDSIEKMEARGIDLIGPLKDPRERSEAAMKSVGIDPQYAPHFFIWDKESNTLQCPAGAKLEVVGLESARPEWLSPVVEELVGKVYRLRVIGSIAVSLCYVAATRFDAMASANVCRSVDAAAGQLVVREAGGFVSFLGHGGVEAPLDLDARYRLVAARSPEELDLLARALMNAGLPED